MSDENFNNNSNDETAALFVSNQKKKAAEEEAKRRAEEEQARLAAAEAEARRMEEEVEERKRRAEEERLALEEEERALAEGRLNRESAAAKPAKPGKTGEPGKSSAGGKSKLPVYIGIAAAAVVVIIIAVVAIGGKKGGSGSSENVAQMETTQLNDEFNTEYVSKEEGFDLKFMYPAGMYTEVTEEKGDGEVTIHFGPQETGNIDSDIVITDYKWDNEDSFITARNAWMCPADLFQKSFKEKITLKAKELIPDINVTEETSADVSDEETSRFFYKCSYTSAEKGNGVISAWVGLNGNGECKRVVVCCRDTGENVEGCKKLCDTFTDKYAGGSLMLPGNNPPKSTDTDGMIEVEEMHMGILTPSGLFEKAPIESNYVVFQDNNGAQVIVHPIETETDLRSGEANITREEIHEKYKSMAEQGVNNYFTALESRMFLDESYDSRDTTVDYTANYKDKIGGIFYWERYRIGYWTDVRTQKHYFYVLITLVPEKNQDVYKQIFDRSLDMLKDI